MSLEILTKTDFEKFSFKSVFEKLIILDVRLDPTSLLKL